ncbi:MAG: flavodoxin family protein [Nitrospira sp.]|nr:flavodoxin family protein [Candidatus Brocadiales bacterium]MBL7049367.1 flavodoxin family protein [Nitrospira sp.]
MKTVAFCGSPRKGGNTELLLTEAVRGVEEGGSSVITFNLNLMNIKACQNCGGCNENGICIFHDDMDQIYSAIRESDRIIIASPIFFFSVSAQVKLMIDRCQSFWCEKYLLEKPVEQGEYGRRGLLLLAGGMKDEMGSMCAEACAKAFFRTVSVSQHEVLSYLDIDEKGAIKSHPTALQEAYDAGRKLVSK